MTDLEFHHVFFSYKDKPVLKDVNLRFAAGQISILMGPSGIGKTTVFRLAAGLETPEEGRITGLAPEGCGVMFQEDRLFPNLSVLENLKICAPERSEAELIGFLKALGLEEEKDQRPDQLSGGMRRRVALIRAAAVDRPLYLLDEPFNGLDEDTKGRTARWLRQRLAGRTVVVITHQASDEQLLGGSIIELEPLE